MKRRFRIFRFHKRQMSYTNAVDLSALRHPGKFLPGVIMTAKCGRTAKSFLRKQLGHLSSRYKRKETMDANLSSDQLALITKLIEDTVKPLREQVEKLENDLENLGNQLDEKASDG